MWDRDFHVDLDAAVDIDVDLNLECRMRSTQSAFIQCVSRAHKPKQLANLGVAIPTKARANGKEPETGF